MNIQSLIRVSRVIALSSMFAVVGTAVNANAANAVDPKTSVTAVFKQLNVQVEGKFKQVRAEAQFDPANIAAARARIEIDTASFDLGSA